MHRVDIDYAYIAMYVRLYIYLNTYIMFGYNDNQHIVSMHPTRAQGLVVHKRPERQHILQSPCIMRGHLSSCLGGICQQDGASSFYSRCTESAASFGTESDVHGQHQPTNRMLPDIPEVNRVDNTIRAFQGATVALETMRSRLQAAKGQNTGPPQERQRQLEKELDWHQQENQFYSVCHALYQELYIQVVDVVQDLILQSHFEPESTPAGDPFLYNVIQKLSAAVEVSQEHETWAEEEWKRYWNIPCAGRASAAWI